MKIIYTNSHFIKLLNIGEKNVIGLPVESVVQNDQLVKGLDGLKEKPKDQVLNDLKIKSGEITYKTAITIVPIISSDVRLMETMIIHGLKLFVKNVAVV